MTAPIYLRHSELAGLLGIDRERLTLEVVNPASGALVHIQILVDGQHLTPAQEAIAGAYIAERLGGPVGFPKPGQA